MIQKEYDGVGGKSALYLRRRRLRRWLNDALHRDVRRHHVDAVLRHDDIRLLLLEAHDRLDRRRILRVGLHQALTLTRYTDTAHLADRIVVVIQINRAVLLNSKLGDVSHYCRRGASHLCWVEDVFAFILTLSSLASSGATEPAPHPPA